MSSTTIDVKEIHWLMDMLQSIDIGLAVIDRNYDVQLWNSFMANHSGLNPKSVIDQNLFELFEEIPERWFRRKAEPVFLLKSRTFTVWEQRPYLFRFKNYRPITSSAEFMYQNVTFIPLLSADGEVNHIGLIVYDVTDAAIGKTALEAANDQLEVLSRTDRLTELNNRGYWEECLVREFKRVRRSGRPCSLIMFDIDHFKKVNDVYGHPAGDEVIRQTASTLRDCIRETDIAGRYGGEEFGVILIDTPAEDAMVVAERLRTAIEALTVQHEDKSIRYTISLGIAEQTEDTPDYGHLVENADQALYRSKESGRNRITIYQKG